jgi:hypothetical protein
MCLRLVVLAACAVSLPALAQQDPATPPRGGEPAVQRIVSEDDHVRIEELRVRGETKRIVVHNKGGRAPSYQIVPSAQGHDPSQDRRGGQRVWSIFSF